MALNRPNFTPAYVLGSVAFFTSAGIGLALLAGYVDVPVPVRNVLLAVLACATVGILAVLVAAVTAAQAASRIPSHSRELSELRDQLANIAMALGNREPADEDETRHMIDNIKSLQQNTAQSQQDLAQMQEILRHVMDKLDALRSVATTPSPAIDALGREADDSGVFPVIAEEVSSPAGLVEAELVTQEIELPALAPSPSQQKPAFTFRPTPAQDETSAEKFDTLEAARSRVDDLMALSNWDSALSVATQFAGDHPEDTDAQWLRQRVEREYSIYREGSVRRLYDQIKDELERKHYRRALSIARRLLDKFADHKKSQKIRQQLPTILENAEIEERQEDESRIQSFIKSKRYHDAMEMSEALIAKYPMSPQAETLEEILPRLRQLAIEQEAETIGRR